MMPEKRYATLRKKNVFKLLIIICNVQNLNTFSNQSKNSSKVSITGKVWSQLLEVAMRENRKRKGAFFTFVLHTESF